MSREALVLLVCCCDFRDGAERLIPSKSLRNAVIRAFPGLLCILRMCAPRRAAAVVRPRGREKSADRRRRILISRLLIIRASVPRWKSPFPAYFKGFPAVSPLIPPYPAFLKYPVSPQPNLGSLKESTLYFSHSLKQRATNKKFWGPLSTSLNGQSGRPRKPPRRGVMIKIKDQCKQTAPARVFHLSLAGAAFYILSLIRCGGLFKFCRDLLEQFADGEVLRADLFALAAL